MAERKNPTNTDILRKLEGMDTRITALESWKIAEDAAKKAIADYRKSEKAQEAEKTMLTESELRVKILKQIGIVLGILTTIAYAYAASRGIHL